MAIQCRDVVNAAVLGGCLLGGGGGGSKKDGFALGRLAVQAGDPVLVDMDEVPDDALLVTVALVGSPASENAHAKPVHYQRSLQILLDALDEKVFGLISNENGAVGTVNGWFQSAMTGLPVVDCPCNGRAHPTGIMGAMNLDQVPEYLAWQAFAGGDAGENRYIEGVIRGRLETAARLVREASVGAGGLVAVARNPVSATHARLNGAPGAIRQAIELGKIIEANAGSGGMRTAEVCALALGGSVVMAGVVTGIDMETKSGFDVGRVLVEDGSSIAELKFWNEYMTLSLSGLSGKAERVGSFPDLISTIDEESGTPVTTSEIRQGMKVAVLWASKERLRLGSGMRRTDLLGDVEQVIGEAII
ncbi:MAG: DUF917 family protein [Firmicutes bacterium]|nr:DUF917 family protein [Bacillota bacterium]